MTARDCPTLNAISAPAWKHWALMLTAIIVGAGVLLVGHTWPQWGASYGPGLARLLKSTSSPVINWFYTLLLFTTAQGAALILWARSRSLKDFNGNYRIWGWAAATWLFFSFAIATQAHVALSETVLHHIRWRTNGAALWCWLLPATAWGWGIALRLEPELRADRSGHFTFLAAGGWYMAAAGVLCQREFWPKVCPAELSVLLAAAFQLMAHASLFLSTTLHARYVLLFSAEPPQTKRRAVTKVAVTVDAGEDKPRRMWPSWLSMRGSAAADETDTAESEDGKPKRGKKRATAATTKKRTTPRKTPRQSKPVEAPAEAEEEGWDESGSEGWDTGETADTKAESAVLETANASKGQNNYRFDGAEDTNSSHYSEDSESDDFKGLSKKERRRLQQQMRDEERKNR